MLGGHQAVLTPLMPVSGQPFLPWGCPLVERLPTTLSTAWEGDLLLDTTVLSSSELRGCGESSSCCNAEC